jgi:hypothetical protein
MIMLGLNRHANTTRLNRTMTQTSRLGEDLARAGRRVAEPAPAVHAHPHGLAAPREIERVPIEPTVLPPAQFTAPRTRHGQPGGFDNQDQTAVTFDNDQNDAPAFGLCPK